MLESIYDTPHAILSPPVKTQNQSFEETLEMQDTTHALITELQLAELYDIESQKNNSHPESIFKIGHTPCLDLDPEEDYELNDDLSPIGIRANFTTSKQSYLW